MIPSIKWLIAPAILAAGLLLVSPKDAQAQCYGCGYSYPYASYYYPGYYGASYPGYYSTYYPGYSYSYYPGYYYSYYPGYSYSYYPGYSYYGGYWGRPWRHRWGW